MQLIKTDIENLPNEPLNYNDFAVAKYFLHGGHYLEYNGQIQVNYQLKKALPLNLPLCHYSNSIGQIKVKLIELFERKDFIVSSSFLSAKWHLFDTELVLTNIYMLYVYNDGSKGVVDVYDELYGQKKMVANWFSGTLTWGRGEVWVQMPRFKNKYAQEIEFSIEQGHVVNYRLIDNTKLYTKCSYIEED